MVVAEGHHAIIIRATTVGPNMGLERGDVCGKLAGAQVSAPKAFLGERVTFYSLRRRLEQNNWHSWQNYMIVQLAEGNALYATCSLATSSGGNTV